MPSSRSNRGYLNSNVCRWPWRGRYQAGLVGIRQVGRVFGVGNVNRLFNELTADSVGADSHRAALRHHLLVETGVGRPADYRNFLSQPAVEVDTGARDSASADLPHDFIGWRQITGLRYAQNT